MDIDYTGFALILSISIIITMTVKSIIDARNNKELITVLRDQVAVAIDRQIYLVKIYKELRDSQTSLDSDRIRKSADFGGSVCEYWTTDKTRAELKASIADR
jgi:hypothetical protein